jgi:hypothetical protein
MHVQRQPVPISERLVRLSVRIGFGKASLAGLGSAQAPNWLITNIKSVTYNMFKRMGRHALRNGIPVASSKSADSWQKRRGKRFQAFLAEIAGQKLGGPPHRASDFFSFPHHLGTRHTRLGEAHDYSVFWEFVGRNLQTPGRKPRHRRTGTAVPGESGKKQGESSRDGTASHATLSAPGEHCSSCSGIARSAAGELT